MNKSEYLKIFSESSLPVANKIIEEKLNPSLVNFETRTLCNSRCSFCPVSIQNEIREDTSMPLSLVKKVSKDLKAKNFKGILGFQLNNEPLIDKNIFDIIKITKDYLPDCRRKIITNGIKLTQDTAVRLIESGINIILVDNYSDKKRDEDRLRSIENFIKNKFPSVKIKIQYERFLTEVKNNRGGRIREDENKMSEIRDASLIKNPKADYPCYRPFSSLVITTDGTIGVCCYDVYFELNIGNVNEGNVVDIWHNEKNNYIRENLKKGNRDFINVCKMCNAEFVNDFQVKKGGLSDYELAHE